MIDISDTAAYAMNMIGLFTDITGVIAIFILRDRGLKELWVNPVHISSSSTFRGHDNNAQFREEMHKIIDGLNRIIRDTNNYNKKLLRKSVSWLALIIIGFLLQVISTIHFLRHSDNALTKQPLPINQQSLANPQERQLR